LAKYTDLSSVKAEKAIMLGAYIIRKLFDAEKIPVDIIKKKVYLRKYTRKKDIVDHTNWHRVDENYDLENERGTKKDWQYIINQIIHSFTFIYTCDQLDRIDGLLFNSDRSKQHELYRIELKDILKMFVLVSEGVITEARHHRSVLKIKKGKEMFGPMKMVYAKYSYPKGFDINKIITESMDGKIYLRDKYN